MEKKPTYIVAVSGGVDSVVLVHKLAKDDKAELIVAHFDHGIRPDSAEDRKFVQQLAQNHDLAFEYAEGKLGPGASEAAARQARYSFLEEIKQKHNADAIITAHHQDDAIETAIINILRGTKSRGLNSLKSTSDIIRPLLNVTKLTIVKYATKHKLKWREDPSNQDTKYLRNYVRQVLIPKLDEADSSWRDKFLKTINKAGRLNRSIESLIDHVLKDTVSQTEHGYKIKRSELLRLPGEVGRELMKQILSDTNQDLNINQHLIKRTWLFGKTAKRGAKLQLGKTLELKIEGNDVLVTTKTSG